MIIFRYLMKEVFTTLISLTAILMLIFLSNQFVQYLNRAASGSIPGMIIMKLMALELPNLMGLLLPLGFYMSLLLAYGRMYSENEMTVLQASGFGPRDLLRHSYIMASVLAFIVGVVVLWGSPLIATERAKLLRSSGVQTLIQIIMPGQFHAINGGQQVFYVQSMNRDHTEAHQIFLAQKNPNSNPMQWDLVWADNALTTTDPKTHEDYVILNHGTEYQGIPGRADYRVTEFSKLKARLPHPTIRDLNEDLRTASTAHLWPLNNSDTRKAAELQWRFSIPIMVLTLTLVAVPLSRVNPREGKFSKLLPAVIFYILYANFMFLARDATASGTIPLWVGMWSVHVVVLIMGLLLVWRNQVKLS